MSPLKCLFYHKSISLFKIVMKVSKKLKKKWIGFFMNEVVLIGEMALLDIIIAGEDVY